jgi:hypothetical protein
MRAVAVCLLPRRVGVPQPTLLPPTLLVRGHPRLHLELQATRTRWTIDYLCTSLYPQPTTRLVLHPPPSLPSQSPLLFFASAMAATHQPQPTPAGLGPTSTSTSTSTSNVLRPPRGEEAPGAGQSERRVVVEEGGVEDFVNDENGEEGASYDDYDVAEEKGKEKASSSSARRNSLREESAYQPSPKLSSSRRSVGCPICFEPIRDPRLLRVCGHTFCYGTAILPSSVSECVCVCVCRAVWPRLLTLTHGHDARLQIA